MIPRINGRIQMKDGVIYLPDPVTIKNDFSEYAVRAFSERAAERGFQSETAEKGFISIVKNDVPEKEAYVLSVGKEGIRVEASGEQGVIWALTTLLKKTARKAACRQEHLRMRPVRHTEECIWTWRGIFLMRGK